MPNESNSAPMVSDTVQPIVGTIALPDTFGKRYAPEDWKTEREDSGVVVAIAGKDLMLSRAQVAQHLNDKDVTIDVLRRRCELLQVEVEKLRSANATQQGRRSCTLPAVVGDSGSKED